MATTEGPDVPSDAVTSSKAEMVDQAPSPEAVRMKRTTSQDIREGTEDLKEAAEQSLNVIMDLGLDGVVRWVSPSWTDVVGTTPDSIQGKAIADVLLDDDRTAFADAVESLKKDDSRSQIIRFNVEMGPLSKLSRPPPPPPSPEQQPDGNELDGVERHDRVAETTNRLVLEGQGIMVYDRSSGGESHVRRILRSRRSSTSTRDANKGGPMM